MEVFMEDNVRNNYKTSGCNESQFEAADTAVAMAAAAATASGVSSPVGAPTADSSMEPDGVCAGSAAAGPGVAAAEEAGEAGRAAGEALAASGVVKAKRMIS